MSAKLPQRRRCKVLTSAGKPCQAPPIGGTKYCIMHTPGNASRLGVKGGHRRMIFNPDNLTRFPEPKSPEDMLGAIARVVVQVHRGELDPRVANSVVYGGAAFFKGSEMEELKQIRAEIKEMKKRFEEQEKAVARETP